MKSFGSLFSFGIYARKPRVPLFIEPAMGSAGREKKKVQDAIKIPLDMGSCRVGRAFKIGHRLFGTGQGEICGEVMILYKYCVLSKGEMDPEIVLLYLELDRQTNRVDEINRVAFRCLPDLGWPMAISAQHDEAKCQPARQIPSLDRQVVVRSSPMHLMRPEERPCMQIRPLR